MRKSIRILGAPLAAALAVVQGCATVQNGNVARSVDAQGKVGTSPVTPLGLEIRGREINDLSSPYFGAIEVTIENKTGDWIRIQGLKVSFGDEATDRLVRIPWGADLQSWQLATRYRQQIEAHNTAVAMALLGAGGGALTVAASGDSGGPRALLGAVYAGTELVATVAAAHAAAEDASSVHPFPENHLLALPISIPPGLFAKRWILFNTLYNPKGPCMKQLMIEYVLATGQRERVWLSFRNRATSKWQWEACFANAPVRPASRPVSKP